MSRQLTPLKAAWSLNYLRHAGAVSPDQPEVRQVLDKLWAAWSPKKGMGFSSYYSVTDLDDTAVGYAVLRWGGYPVNTDIFAQFEEEDHFRCFPGEVDPSISATLRLVDALKWILLIRSMRRGWKKRWECCAARHNERQDVV